MELESVEPSSIEIPFRDEPSCDGQSDLESEDGITTNSSTRATDGSDDELLPTRRRTTAIIWEDA